MLWKPPFIVEVTDALKPGTNIMCINVTNTWKNRLAGDDDLSVGDRTTWTWGRKKWFSPEETLEPAGLLGPVMLKKAHSAKQIELD